MIYGLSGYFKREKNKKNMLFLVTLPCAKPMAHGELTILCRVPRDLAHGEVCCHLGPNQDYAVCQNLGSRQTSPLRRVPRARGARRSF